MVLVPPINKQKKTLNDLIILQLSKHYRNNPLRMSPNLLVFLLISVTGKEATGELAGATLLTIQIFKDLNSPQESTASLLLLFSALGTHRVEVQLLSEV